jgi:hypothetical protein
MEGMMRFVNRAKRSTGCSKNTHISKRAQQGLFLQSSTEKLSKDIFFIPFFDGFKQIL